MVYTQTFMKDQVSPSLHQLYYPKGIIYNGLLYINQFFSISLDIRALV